MLNIKKVEIGSEYMISFVTDKGALKIELEGDCCSRSYFTSDSLDEIKDIEPGETLTLVEETYSHSSDNGESKYYFLHIKTDKRSLSLDWRNESNGYYSGWVNFYWNGDRQSLQGVVEDSFRLLVHGEG